MSEMYSLALYRFDIPGEAGFPLNSVYAKPSSTGEAGSLMLTINFLWHTNFTKLLFLNRYYASIFGTITKGNWPKSLRKSIFN